MISGINKISGILPSSPRIEAADMSQEKPIRSGSVGIGQPTSIPANRPSVIQKETVGGLTGEKFDTSLKKPGQKSDEAIVDEMSSTFFLKNRGSSFGEPTQNAVGAGGAQAPKLSIRV